MPKVPDCVVCYCFFGQKTSQKMTMKDIYHKKRLWGPGEIIKNTALIHFHYVLRVWNEWVFVIFTINCQRIRSVIHQEQNFNFQNNKFQLHEYISAYRTLIDLVRINIWNYRFCFLTNLIGSLKQSYRNDQYFSKMTVCTLLRVTYQKEDSKFNWVYLIASTLLSLKISELTLKTNRFTFLRAF